jgi:uncharacterized protein (TIGR02246 family)
MDEGGVMCARYPTTLLAIFLAFAASQSAADTAPTRKSAKSDEAAVLHVIERWASAFRAHDLDGIMSVYASGDAVTAYDIGTPLQYVGKAAYRESYSAFLDQYTGSLEFEARDAHVLVSGDLAIYYALERLGGILKSGERSSPWVRVTTALKRAHGQWLIVHDHVSAPVDFETGKPALDLKP